MKVVFIMSENISLLYVTILKIYKKSAAPYFFLRHPVQQRIFVKELFPHVYSSYFAMV